jgi:TusA-related sulfurtransferase
MKQVDARGLSCPEPVILARSTVNEMSPGDKADILVEAGAARDNVLRAVHSLGCDAVADEYEDGYRIHITKK